MRYIKCDICGKMVPQLPGTWFCAESFGMDMCPICWGKWLDDRIADNVRQLVIDEIRNRITEDRNE